MKYDPLLPEDRARLVRLLIHMEPEHAQDVAVYLGIDLGAELTKRSEPREEDPARCTRRMSVTDPDSAPGHARDGPPAQGSPCCVVRKTNGMRVLRDQP